MTTTPDRPMHTLFVLLQDKPGALHRVVTLFRRRGYNVVSLGVERSEVAGVSRMTATLEAPSAEQVVKELERFVDVLSVRDVTRRPEPAASASAPARTQADGVCDEEEAA